MQERRQDHIDEYTNRELFLLIESNQEKADNFHEVVIKRLDALVEQTTKTNGNVMSLLLWRATVKGATWIVPLVVSAIISSIVAYILK